MNTELPVSRLAGIAIGSMVVFEQSITDLSILVPMWKRQDALANINNSKKSDFDRLLARKKLEGKVAVVCPAVPLQGNPGPTAVGCEFFLRFRTEEGKENSPHLWLPAFAREVRVTKEGTLQDELRIRQKLGMAKI